MTEPRLQLEPMNLAHVPLAGRVLIEASAGTGKTWSIAALYVRLLLELHLPVQGILVLTFTNAATAELRTRIRKRLIEVRDALAHGTEDDEDVLLAHVLRTSADPARDLLWLTAAIESFDLASIYTIHGFCQRALSEHAFESGLPFESEILSEDGPLIEAAVRDCWRRDLANAHSLWAQWLHAQGIHPGTWAKKIATLCARPEAKIYLPDAPPENLEQLYLEALEHARKLWHDSAEEAFELIRSSTTLNMRKYSAQHVSGWCAEIESALMQPELPPKLPKDLPRFTPECLRANLKKEGEPPKHALFDALAEWQRLHMAFAARLAHWTVATARAVDAELQAQKKQSGLQSYDDLLRNLEQALAVSGDRALAKALRRRYGAALIDEFQDTDPRQYGIFEAIYSGTEQPRYFVGDPKQAIYAFRGADVQAYLRARRAAHTGFTLQSNRRSTPHLVRALNALYETNANAFYVADIEYEVVKAAGRPAALRIEGENNPAALRCWFMSREETDKPIAKGSAGERAIEATADEIARLLVLGKEDRAQLRGERETRSLSGGDIAVLTRTHTQAQEVRAALALRGVASVTYGQDNVFHSEEAAELACILAAIAEPAREDLLRAALATKILGRDAQALEALTESVSVWEALLERYAGYQELARKQGFMRMWRSLLADEGVPARLLGLPQGERRLTNLQHLADLVHAEADEQAFDLESLLRYLDRRRAEEANKTDNQQLRLESDENLVRILTVHAAKGLEFSIVFCPFLWDVPQNSRPDEVLRFHDAKGERAFDLDSSDCTAHLARAKEEAFAERLRTAYVALTRAKQRCVFVWGGVKAAEESALAWLLHGAGLASPQDLKLPDDAALRAALAGVAERSDGAMAVLDWPAHSALLAVTASPAQRLSARVFDSLPPRARRLSSFSGLIAVQEREASDYDALSIAGTSTDISDAADNLLALPGGVRTGTLIHQLFEGIDFRAARGAAVTNLVRRKLVEFDFEPRWAAALERMLADVVATPLNEKGSLRLDRITPEQRIVEMEFLFPVGETVLPALREALAPLRAQGSRLPDAIGRTVIAPAQGFIRGFIDLVFELDGRYYLADYKSNRLGMRLEDYAPTALAEAMHASWYDLQYLLYTLALHRHLRLRLPDYDYETHFGGVYYLFVRGMSPEQGAARGVYFTQPAREMIEALDRLLGGSS